MVLCFTICPKVTFASEAVNVYVFKSSTCPHCAEAMEFFENLSKDEEYGAYFNLVPYETNGNTAEIKENINLAEKVAKYFGGTFDGVPLIVIGDKNYEGYASSMDEQLKSKIKNCYTSGCEDIVEGVKNGTIKKSSFATIMTLAIVGVLVVGIGYFIYIARKTNEEVEEMEVHSEDVTPTVKKKENSNKKKTTTKAPEKTKSKTKKK